MTKPPMILSPNCTKFLLDNEVYSFSAVCVLIRGNPSENLKLKRDQSDSQVLYVTGDSSIFKGLHEQDVVLLSDMSFLVKHIAAFLHNSKLQLMEGRTGTSVMPVFDHATEEQCAAASGILNSPYTYGWGPPGAGKTTHVLVPCAAELLRAGKRVILAAPTNITADTALMNVLDLLGEEARQHIVRLGVPTRELLESYPVVCEKQERKKGMEVPETWAEPFMKCLKEAVLVCGTVDTLIWQLLPNIEDFQPDQIIIDEAAYTSLAKVLPFLAAGVPLALLGDHKQLLPVCEMANDKRIYKLENAAACLWTVSAYYLETALACNSITDFAECCFGQQSLQKPTCFSEFRLTVSFRYGKKLAGVLSECVYDGQFFGSTACGTEILVVDRGKERGVSEQKRTSWKEVQAVSAYLNCYGAEQSCAVLTPYRNQKNLLQQILTNVPVMTVHKAQGQEWNTVIFSVVDDEDKWFTDSLNRHTSGLNVINTAVSWAKKRLVIVCDVGYWSSQPHQLLAKLISVGKTIPYKAMKRRNR